MNKQSVIPDVDTIVCILNDAVTESLNFHDTYKVASLSQRLWKLNHNNHSVASSIQILEEILEKVYHNQSNINNSHLAQKVERFIRENKGTISNVINPSTIEPFFAEGVNCNLLQPDGKGWQKGKIKICFEFIPEEPEPVAMQEKPVETHSSPLDEIRNSLVESN